MSIECRSLTKFYGQKKALNDVSLKISDHKVTGLLGPNGAGKSTLIKLMTGLLYPDQGSVSIDNYDVHGEHKQAMAHLGAIIEYPNFYADLSARRNLAILSGGHGKLYEEKVAVVTEFLNIKDVLDRKAGTFSTGMKQRLGIALALLPDSRYIILDEPANGLDPAGIAEIRKLIKEYNRQFGITVLVSSHLLCEMEMICDDVILLVKGELKAAGCLKDLLSQQNYVSVQVDRMQEMEAFLQKARAEKCYWIDSEPEFRQDKFCFRIPGGVAPEMVSREIFQNNFNIAYFSCERQNLEDFFLQSTNVKAQEADK